MFTKKLLYTVVSMLAVIGSLRAQNEGYSVGTPQGSLSVSEMGAAVYNLDIEVPNGGPLTPQIGLQYNSQMNGYGLAGYGVNITGMSCITRGGKDLFHDGEQKGVTYTAGDNYYLDGKRLILEDGTQGMDNSRYSLEGDPFTQVRIHQKTDYYTTYVYHEPSYPRDDDKLYAPENRNLRPKPYWSEGGYERRSVSVDVLYFEVKYPTGVVSVFGGTTDSRFEFRGTDGLPSKTIAWYINRTEDKYSNIIEYSYVNRCSEIQPVRDGADYKYVDDLVVRPKSIRYALNDKKSREITNTINFEYKSLGDNAHSIAVAGRTGKIDVCLESIITKTNNYVYRKYTFTYDNTSDATPSKWSRLVSVTESNGNGESYKPIALNWEKIPSSSIQMSSLNVKTTDSEIKDPYKTFSSADVNGDGISDIIQISQANGSGKTKVYVNRSQRNSVTNEITYDQLIYDLGDCGSVLCINNQINGTQCVDYDGDGLYDIIIPISNYVEGDNGRVVFNVIYGKDIVGGRQGSYFWSYVGPYQKASWEPPLIAIFDIDGDGKDEIVCMEKRKDWNNQYNAYYMEYSPSLGQNIKSFGFTLSPLEGDPKWLFWGDYNSDGLLDLMLVGDNNYVINYNLGGNDQAYKHFTTSKTSFSGKSFKSYDKIFQGDFNGDGLTDFLCNNKGEDFFRIAYNNGNGTFSSKQTESIGVSDIKDTDKDNDFFSISVLDLNHDGLSDVLVCKAAFKKHDHLFEKSYYRYTSSCIKWLIGNGTGFINIGDYTTNCQDDTNPSSIFIGDFDGDGHLEIANYGNSLIGSSSSSENCINVYKSGGDLSQLGKIKSITDGLGNTSTIQYSTATNPNVYYISDNVCSIPNTHKYTIPLSVVSSITHRNGIVSAQTINYSYQDLLIHNAGAGLLGFNGRTIENKILSTKETSMVTEWKEIQYDGKHSAIIPCKLYSCSSIGSKQSASTSMMTIKNVNNNYFSYCDYQEEKDWYGNIVTTFTQYDTGLGVLKENLILYDGDNMYKKVCYTDYHEYAGVYLPGSVVTTQKHTDDSKTCTSETLYAYDNYGNVVSTITNANTDLALTTIMTYDAWGNVKSSKSEGNGVSPIITKYEYDTDSHRLLTKSYTEPASSVTTYEYDVWGNVLKETDATNLDNLLTTTHEYDGWGREVKTINADGTTSLHELGWNGNSSYFVWEIADNSPTVTTIYDGSGRELYSKSTGKGGIEIIKSNIYDFRGRIIRTVNKTGNLIIHHLYDYDEYDRVVRDSISSGLTTNYSYDNRSVTTTTDGRTYTKTTDAWGNPVKTTDPLNGTVTYSYSSNGNPKSISSNGAIVTMSYDAAGNQIRLTDPDAGKMTYDYAADGTLLSQTDARGITTENVYDNLGRISSSTIGDKVIVYKYGISGYNNLQLVSESLDDKSITYDYDHLGHVVKTTRTMNGHEPMVTSYKYNDRNQLESTTYPGNLVESYVYDDCGFKVQTKVGDMIIWNLNSYDGLKDTTTLLGKLTSVIQRDSCGYLIDKRIVDESTNTILEKLLTNYDGATNNLRSRQRNDNPIEHFGYDNLDRLVSVTLGNDLTMSLSYASNGNITNKSDIGAFTYGSNTNKPHAVKRIDNLINPLKSSLLKTQFNALGKVDQIVDEVSHKTMDITYGPDQQRWCSVFSDKNGVVRTTIYGGNYEKIIEGDTIREFYYLDGNVIIVRENGGVFTPYLAFKDNLGSFLSIMDKDGYSVFDADYDAWGKQEVHLNDIGFQRGYTGHEMWNKFDIINMNGRLYDPTIARFLSPDNYVQAPDNSQSFNRYSYCLNNPLKYNDPSGEFWEWVIAGAIMGAIQSGAMAEMSEGKNFWSGAWKGAIVGAGSAAAGMGVGAAVSSALGSTGAITGFASGFASGFAGGAVSGFASGTSSAWLNGSSFKSGLQSGLFSSAVSAVMGGTIGGIHGGLDAYQHGGNFWTGGNPGISNQTHTAVNSISSPELTQTVYLDNIDVLGSSNIKVLPEVIIQRYNLASYSLAAMSIFNQIWGTDYIMTTGENFFSKCWHHYQRGGGRPMYVDANSLGISSMYTQADIKNGVLNTFGFGKINNVSATIGKVGVEQVENNLYRLLPDSYDFNIESGDLLTKRNIGTYIGSFVNNTRISSLYGGPFDIHFVGLVPIY